MVCAPVSMIILNVTSIFIISFDKSFGSEEGIRLQTSRRTFSLLFKTSSSKVLPTTATTLVFCCKFKEPLFSQITFRGECIFFLNSHYLELAPTYSKVKLFHAQVLNKIPTLQKFQYRSHINEFSICLRRKRKRFWESLYFYIVRGWIWLKQKLGVQVVVECSNLLKILILITVACSFVSKSRRNA